MLNFKTYRENLTNYILRGCFDLNIRDDILAEFIIRIYRVAQKK